MVDFNSHAHVERDAYGFGSLTLNLHISTHTLTWSVTIRSRLTAIDELNFNSHAHVERDRRTDNPGRTDFYFNSHAHVERDFVWDFSFLDEDISTHTLTWSVTRHQNSNGYGN